MDTSADARTKWAAMWAAVGRSDTTLIFHMSHRSRDHYTLVHAARRFYVELGMPCDVPGNYTSYSPALTGVGGSRRFMTVCRQLMPTSMARMHTHALLLVANVYSAAVPAWLRHVAPQAVSGGPQATPTLAGLLGLHEALALAALSCALLAQALKASGRCGSCSSRCPTRLTAHPTSNPTRGSTGMRCGK